ncbi:hypothetical protein ACSQ67_014345 [Phaseolus vulgaris]
MATSLRWCSSFPDVGIAPAFDGDHVGMMNWAGEPGVYGVLLEEREHSGSRVDAEVVEALEHLDMGVVRKSMRTCTMEEWYRRVVHRDLIAPWPTYGAHSCLLRNLSLGFRWCGRDWGPAICDSSSKVKAGVVGGGCVSTHNLSEEGNLVYVRVDKQKVDEAEKQQQEHHQKLGRVMKQEEKNSFSKTKNICLPFKSFGRRCTRLAREHRARKSGREWNRGSLRFCSSLGVVFGVMKRAMVQSAAMIIQMIARHETRAYV